MLQEIKAKVMVFLPVMIEIEKMGHNPVKLMFEQPTIELMEIVYRALTVCKTKYPEWYSVVAKECKL